MFLRTLLLKVDCIVVRWPHLLFSVYNSCTICSIAPFGTRIGSVQMFMCTYALVMSVIWLILSCDFADETSRLLQLAYSKFAWL